MTDADSCNIKRTWGHVEGGAASKVRGDGVRGGESKVGKLAGHSIVSDENILRLQVPVVDSNRVAIFDGIQNLEKSAFGHGIITHVLALLGDVGEEVALWAVFNDNVCAVGRIHDLDKRDHVGMGAGLVVQLDLPLLELSLARLKTNLVECFYCIGDVGLDVHGRVHDAVGANAENASQLEASGENLA